MSNKGFDQNRRFDEYGNYGENNPPVGDTESYTKARMTNSTWHYQLMRHKNTMSGREYYAIHEYYHMEDEDGWSEAACYVDGDSVEDVKWVLKAMLEDIEKHGVKDYE